MKADYAYVDAGMHEEKMAVCINVLEYSAYHYKFNAKILGVRFCNDLQAQGCANGAQYANFIPEKREITVKFHCLALVSLLAVFTMNKFS